jgi:hypothetical protein
MSKLSYPLLKIPVAPETNAFRAVEGVLANDQVLRTTVNANGFISWTGEAKDLMEPVFAICPYLAISPNPEASEWQTEQQHRMPMSVNFIIATAGTNVDNLINFWGVIRTALFPPSTSDRSAVMAALQGAGVSKPILRMGGYGVKTEEKGSMPILVGRASLSLVMLINTF